jgi:hypothetical protein
VMPMSPLLRSVFVAGLVMGGVACTSFPTQAKEDFAKKFSCPEEQVTVKDRKDLNADDVLERDRKPRKKDVAPPEIASDRARLAKWTKDRDDAEATRRSFHSSYDVLEVAGCGHKNLVVCHRPTGKGNNSARPSCSIEGSL